MYDLGNVVGGFFKTIMVLLIVCLPLAIWKVIDILIWAFGYINNSIK